MWNKTQRGFSLVSAIFLLVVLAVLGGAMVTFSTTQSQTQAMDAMGSRAYEAANAGIEWAAYNIATSPGVAKAAAPVFVPGTGTALGGKLAPFTVSVGYTAVAHSDAAIAGSLVGNMWTYDITASAVYGVPGATDYFERVVNAKM
jgi:MSHA biogenesis protein MshP